MPGRSRSRGSVRCGFLPDHFLLICLPHDRLPFERFRILIFYGLFLLHSRLLGRIQALTNDHLLVIKRLPDAVRDCTHDEALIGEADVHFRRMHIHIHELSVYGDRQACERILMLHQLVPVAILDSERYDTALYISSVHIVIFKVPVPARNGGLCDKARNFDSLLCVIDRKDLRCKLPSVDVVDRIPHFPVTGRGDAARSVHDKIKCDPGIRERELLDIPSYMGGFRHGGLQEFCSGRGIIEYVPDDDRRSVRRTDLLIDLFSSTLQYITDGGQLLRLLGDELNPAHRCDAGEGLAPKAQRSDLDEIFH